MEVGIKWPCQKNSATVNDVVVLIDILRATSSITTLIDKQTEWVLPVVDVEEARKIAAKENAMLMGERNCVKLKGFNFGNSPNEIMQNDVKGARVVFTSTNFPKTLAVAGNSPMVLIGSMLNITAVTTYAYQYASENNLNICYIGAGYEGKPSDEDLAFAGASAKIIEENINPSEDVKDAIEIANQKGTEELIKNSEHAARLYKTGFDKDVEYCSRTDVVEVVGVYKDGKISEYEESPAAK